MMDWLLKESHWGKTIKYFMTTNHHLKSFLWFPYEQSRCPRNPMSVHKLHLPAFFSHWKCHQRIHYPLWDLVNGTTAPHSTLKAEAALSCRGFPGQSLETVSETFRPKTTTEEHPSPGSLECSFLVAASTSPIFYQQMKEFYNTFCHYQ